MLFWGCAAVGYSISNRNSFYAHAKLHLRVDMIFPDPLNLLECSVFQVIVYPVSLSSPEV